MKTIGLVGEPGVGKTTTMRLIIQGMEFLPEQLGKAKWMRSEAHRVILMGTYYGEAFDGTDRLSMSCYSDLEKAALYFASKYPDYSVLWEGDRLTRNRWITALKEVGAFIRVFCLVADPEVTQARREGRGSTQNESWIKGRISTSHRLAEMTGAEVVDMTSGQSGPELAERIREEIRTGGRQNV